MKDVYVLGACRTAIGSFGGSLKSIRACELGALVIRQACLRAGIGPGQAEQVMMGNVLQAGQGQNPARQAQLGAGIPVEAPAVTVNKVCGSGLYAVNLAAALIKAGQADCLVAGGMENMSMAPHLADMRWGHKMGNAALVDSMIHDGLWDIFNDYHMGVTAENIAKEYNISREEQDGFALASQRKAAQAIKAGKFKGEIVPVEIPQRKGAPVVFEQDEYVRMDASPESLQKLRPAFCKDGTVTAGNASGINDGAAAMIVVSDEFIEKNKLTPQAKWVSGASCGVLPEVMGIGPVPAVKKALRCAGLEIGDMELIEANEAFAAQALAVEKGIGAKREVINVNGGAIALGHPIGASGARIAVTLLHEMADRGKRYGLATLCVGGGMGEAAIFMRDERCR